MILRLLGVGTTLAVAVVAAYLAVLAFALGPGMDCTFLVLSAPAPMLDILVGLDGFAAPFLALLALLSAVVALWNVQRGRPADSVLIAAFTAAMLLVLTARSVACFFLAWEAMSLISTFLIAAHHERRYVRRATFTYLAVAQSGALCILAALVLLAVQTGSPEFGTIAQRAAQLPLGLRTVVFGLALVGFGSKAGLMPLHFWLPRAHPVAPAGASALLSGAMLKVALFGLAITALQLAAPAPAGWGIALIAIGMLTALGGILYAVVDRDLKRLLAYSSVENVGIIVAALGVAIVGHALENPLVANLALTAALFAICNHAIFKALLFLCAGTIAESEGTSELERLGGLRRSLRWTTPLFFIGCASIAGVPAFNGFVSEWLLFRSLIALLAAGDDAVTWVAIAAIAALALTAGLAAACFVKVFGVAFLGAPRHSRPRPPEEFGPATAGVAILAALCVAVGLAPEVVAAPLALTARNAFGDSLAFARLLTSLPPLPITLALLPLLGGALSLALAARRADRRVPAWTCGSPVTPASQYTATAFSKPLRTIFAFVLLPGRSRRIETGGSTWFPSKIVYRTSNRYLIDEFARTLAGVTLVLARRSRAVQSGSLRLYLAYALAALVLAVAVAR